MRFRKPSGLSSKREVKYNPDMLKLVLMLKCILIMTSVITLMTALNRDVAGQERKSASPEDYYKAWTEGHVTSIDPSKVRHRDLRGYLDRLQAAGLRINEVGRSGAGREIRAMEFGRGPLKVFLWSQMHGDEPTATSALIDLFHYWQSNRHLPAVAAIEQSLTVRAVPMLNPDGAELFQRRNLQSIDINRDARSLVTPEGQLLKRLRDEWQPAIGFNLHNQNTRTAVGETGRQATISLLAVAHDPSRSDNPGRVRSKKICSTIIHALSPYIDGQIGRYDDTFNPRAFGDLISQWGTPVVLIETGGWQGHSEMDLVRLNFVALAYTLQELAAGAVDKANPAAYDALPYNETGALFSLIIRHATIINRYREGAFTVPPFTADLAINLDATRATIADLGDLGGFTGLDEIDATGWIIAPVRGNLRTGSEAALLFYKKDRAAAIDWAVDDLESRYPPEAVFNNGKWTGGKWTGGK